MAFALLDQIRSIFDGDPGVRKVADDPVLSAELLMLFRMILADGTVSESEMVAFRRICKDAFGIQETSIDAVIEYLNEFGYETNGSQAIALFRDLDVERRKQLASIWQRSPRRIRSWPRARCASCAARSTCSTSAPSMW